MNHRIAFATFTLTLPPLALANQAGPPELSESLGQLGLGLGVVIVLLLGALWLVKRLSGPRGGRNGMMKVIGTMPIGTRERVVLLEVGDKVLVVGVAANSVNTLHTFDAEEIHAHMGESAPSGGQEFSRWLGKAIERREPSER